MGLSKSKILLWMDEVVNKIKSQVLAVFRLANIFFFFEGKSCFVWNFCSLDCYGHSVSLMELDWLCLTAILSGLGGVPRHLKEEEKVTSPPWSFNCVLYVAGLTVPWDI